MKQPIHLLKNTILALDVLLIVAAGTVCFFMHLYCFSGANRGSTRFQLNETPRSILSMLYPAVFFAAGRGMGTSDIGNIPELQSFIFDGHPYFDPESIPTGTQIRPLDTPFECTHIYILYAVGIFWRLFGISYSVLYIFCACICGLCACLLYGIFRLGLGRMLSLFMAIGVCLSPLMMSSSLDIRDYFKAPFFLAIFWILGLLVIRAVSKKKLVILAILSGAIIGIGIGTRPDIMIALPPVVLCLILCRSDGTIKAWHKSTAIALFIGFFLACGALPLRGMMLDRGQQLTHHTYFMGLSDPYEKSFGFGGASYADFSFPDEVILAMVNTYARRQGDFRPMINPNTSEYKRAMGDLNAPLPVDPLLLFRGDLYGSRGREFMWAYIRTFPADLVTRAWCALRATLQAHGAVSTYGFPDGNFPSGLLGFFLSFLQKLAVHLGAYGLFYIVCALFLVAVKDLKASVLIFLLLAWFGGGTSLSFQFRHMFYLAFVPFLGMLLAIKIPCVWLLKIIRDRSCSAELLKEKQSVLVPKALINLFAFITFTSTIVFLPLAVLRPIQRAQVESLANRIAAKPMVPLRTAQKNDNGYIRIELQDMLPGLEEKPHGEAAWEYLAGVFRINEDSVPLKIEYSDEDTDTMTLYGSSEGWQLVTLYFPVYEIGIFPYKQTAEDTLRLIAGSKPEALFPQIDRDSILIQIQSHRRKLACLSFPEGAALSFEGMYRVVELDGLCILPFIQIPEDKRAFRPYKTCTFRTD